MLRSLVWLTALLLSSCANFSQAADFTTAAYPLDDLSRWLDSGSKLPCEAGTLELVSYRGDQLRYDRPLLVHPAFRERLAAFEAIVDEVARDHFGRAPRRIVHLGSYACRSVRGRPQLVSEHALGNALDVAGFDFGPLSRKDPAFTAMPKPLRRAFQVRLDKHWSATGSKEPYALFLRALAARIAERPDVFRVVLGPGWPGHHNHFHLDNAPYRMVRFDRI